MTTAYICTVSACVHVACIDTPGRVDPKVPAGTLIDEINRGVGEVKAGAEEASGTPKSET